MKARPPEDALSKVDAWWRGQPVGERILRVVLALVLASSFVVVLVQVVRSYEHPRLQNRFEPRSSLMMPVVTFCPYDLTGGPIESVVAVPSSVDGDQPEVAPTYVMDVPDGKNKCYVWDLGLDVAKSPAFQGSVGLSLYVRPNRIPVTFQCYTRYSRPERVEQAVMLGRLSKSMQIKLVPGDDGESSVQGRRTIAADPFNATMALMGTWAMRLQAVEDVDVRGRVTRRSVDIDPLHVLTPFVIADNDPAPDVYLFFKNLQLLKRSEFVANDWLYLVGTVGGVFSVVKLIMHLYQSSRPKPPPAAAAAAAAAAVPSSVPLLSVQQQDQYP